MAENLRANVPTLLQSINTRYLFTLRLDVKPMALIGDTPAGFKRVGVIPGGVFEGERLNGIVLDGGSDWQTVGSDGTVYLDVKLMLQTDDGELVTMTYKGLRAGERDVLQRVDRGEAVDPTTYYFRTTVMFEAAAAKYRWLNHLLAIGNGIRTPKGPIYNLFEVL
jgi:Protein of unknown function (DUF3237)